MINTQRQKASWYMLMINFTVVLIITTTCFTYAATQTPHTNKATSSSVGQAQIEILAHNILGPVNRKVLGFNVLAANKWIINNRKWRNMPPSRFPYIRTGGGLWNPRTMKPKAQAVKLVQNLHPGILRYPGGNLVHGYNWKDAVGPLSKRGNWRFGIDQYIEFCQKVGAQPQFTINEYSSSPQDAAELVEYLNSPATPDHPWAMKRAKWGHPKSYNVKYFEFGNETNQGNQRMIPQKCYTGVQYAQLFKQTAEAMRKIDPTIKIGIVAPAGNSVNNPWITAVLKDAGKDADFAIVHTYSVHYRGNTAHPQVNSMMQACLASDQQMAHKLEEVRRLIRRYVGHDLPLAITEYNASFVQMKPRPYRYSYGPALFSADYVRVLLQPSNHILMADYFELINGYWGMLHGPGGDLRGLWPESKNHKPKALRKMAAYPLYRLWGNHLGSEVTKVDVTCPHISFKGFSRTAPAQGNHYQPSKQLNTKNLVTARPSYKTNKNKHFSIRHTSSGQWKIQLNGITGRVYPLLQKIELPKAICPPKGGMVQVSFEAYYKPVPNSGKVRLGLGLMDSRGWKDTGNAATAMGIEAARHWQNINGTLYLLPDAKGVSLLARLLAGNKPVHGTVYIRNLRVDVFSKPVFPAYPAVTAFSSIENSGKTLYLIVFNKSTKKAMRTNINLSGFKATKARYWQVTGPSLAANNIKKQVIRMTKKNRTLTMQSPNSARWTFPPISMTAIEFYK